jgi:nucleotide-binding universal stress UspA family protein
MDGAPLMPDILAFTETDDDTDGVVEVTAALAKTLHLGAEQRGLPTGTDDVTAAVLLAVDEPTVRLAVLPYRSERAGRLITQVIRHCPKPVVLVPADRIGPVPELISRVLVALDGTVESAETVAETVALFAASGADILVVHVIDKTTVPKFWDQPIHARKSWDKEFLARYCDQPEARIELRSGSPGASILDVAATEHADLIALGWRQNLSEGRARTVRRIVAQANTPLLLLPVASSAARHRMPPTASEAVIKP